MDLVSVKTLSIQLFVSRLTVTDLLYLFFLCVCFIHHSGVNPSSQPISAAHWYFYKMLPSSCWKLCAHTESERERERG